MSHFIISAPSYQECRQKSSQALSYFWGKALQIYTYEYTEGRGLFFLSPNILERKMRKGIEIECEIDEYGRESWFMADSTVLALLDRLLQVRDLVARYCGSQAHINDYSCTSPLYDRFRESGIHFPFEHFMMFDAALWKGSFCSYDMLNITIGKAQIWAMGMIMALHCLAKYDGASTVELPHVSCAHLTRAAAAFHHQKELDRRIHAVWVKPSEYVPDLDEEPNSSPEASPLPTPPASEAASDSVVEVEDMTEWF